MKGVFRWLREWGAPLVVGGALATVTLVAGFISYTHICALTLQLFQSWKTAHLTPFAVDGQIVIGGAVLATVPGRHKWWGLLGIVPGLAESLFANWESGIRHGLLAAMWATVAAQAFAASSFLFERWLKARVSARGQGRPVSTEEALRVLLATGSRRMLAGALSVEPGQIQRWERLVATEMPEVPVTAASNGGGGHG